MPFIQLIIDIFTFVFALQKIKEITGFNLASNKDSYICNKKLQKALTDGELDMGILIDYDLCKDNGKLFIHVYLEELYNVRFVILHTVEKEESLYSLWVDLKEADYIVPCSIPMMVIAVPRLRVNCQPSTKVFSEVLMFVHSRRIFYTPEVEVHSLGQSINGHSLVYRGCFSQFSHDAAPINWEKCQLKCLKGSFFLIGIKDNKYCGCQNSVKISHLALTTDCDIKCDDGLRYCGGKKFFSVYLVTVPLPYYKGCYDILDPSLSTIPQNDAPMSVAECLRYCEKHRYAVIQIQRRCLCVDKQMFEQNRVNDSECNAICENSKEYCGGSRHASVWGTCRADNPISMVCSDLFNCDIHQRYDKFGICEGICKPNFKGEYCMDRIVNITILPRKKKYGQHVSVEVSSVRDFLHKVQMFFYALDRFLPFILPWCSIAIFALILWFTVPFRTSDEDSDSIVQEHSKKDVMPEKNIIKSPSGSIGSKDTKDAT